MRVSLLADWYRRAVLVLLRGMEASSFCRSAVVFG